jgi:uncharacterized protein YktB (UPF0637 family)
MSAPEMFDIDLAALKRLLQDLPDDWRVSADHPKRWILFDADMTGRAMLDLELQTVTMIDSDGH